MRNKRITSIAAIIAVAVVSTSAYGQSFAIKDCNDSYVAARTIMKLRQENIPMPQMISAFGEYAEDTETKLELFALAYKAYDEPLYASAAGQERAIGRFANEAYMDCIKFFGRR